MVVLTALFGSAAVYETATNDSLPVSSTALWIGVGLALLLAVVVEYDRVRRENHRYAQKPRNQLNKLITRAIVLRDRAQHRTASDDELWGQALVLGIDTSRALNTVASHYADDFNPASTTGGGADAVAALADQYVKGLSEIRKAMGEGS